MKICKQLNLKLSNMISENLKKKLFLIVFVVEKSHFFFSFSLFKVMKFLFLKGPVSVFDFSATKPRQVVDPYLIPIILQCLYLNII